MVELLSIVVVGSNQRTSLEALLRQLQTLQCAKELIYIDLNSKDDSVYRASLYADRIYQTKDKRGVELRNWAYGIGTAHAEYDWVLTLDAACRLSEEYLDFLGRGLYAKSKSDTLAYLGHVFAKGCLWEPSRSYFWMRWSQMGSALYEGILWRKTAALAAGNWNSNLRVHGAYDLLHRLAPFASSVQHLGWGTVEIGEMPLQIQSMYFRGTSKLFWQSLVRGHFGLWLRSHPWFAATLCSSILLYALPNFKTFALWFLIQIGMMVSYGSAVQGATYLRWFYWLLFPYESWKRVKYERVPVAQEKVHIHPMV